MQPYIAAATSAEAAPVQAPAPAPAASSGRNGAAGQNSCSTSTSARGTGSGANHGASQQNHGTAGSTSTPRDDGGSNANSGSIVVKMRGLPYSTTEAEIASFFSGLKIASGGVSIGRDAQGRASGEAHVEFVSDQDAQSAMLLNRQRIGSRYIELFRTKQAPSAARRALASSMQDGAAASSDSLRLRGMPFNSTEADVQAFFKGYNVTAGGIKLGPQVGQGTVRFSNAEDARRALVNLNRSYMGNRYIELFYAT